MVVRCASLGRNAQAQIPTRPLRTCVTHSQFLDLSENRSQDPEWHPTQGDSANSPIHSPPQIHPEPTTPRNCSRCEDVARNALLCGANILVCVC